MKYIKSFFVLVVAILGFSSLNVQAQRYVKIGASVSSPAIEKKVFKELIRLPRYDVFDSLKYKVEGNTVTLYGKVVEPITKSDAENVVEDIAGVTRVVNNIEVLPLSPFDDSIRYRALQTLSNRGGLYRYFLGANPSVRIIVSRGNIELEGYVANRGDYNLMNIVANSIPNVFSVKNNLVVESEIER